MECYFYCCSDTMQINDSLEWLDGYCKRTHLSVPVALYSCVWTICNHDLQYFNVLASQSKAKQDVYCCVMLHTNMVAVTHKHPKRNYSFVMYSAENNYDFDWANISVHTIVIQNVCSWLRSFPSSHKYLNNKKKLWIFFCLSRKTFNVANKILHLASQSTGKTNKRNRFRQKSCFFSTIIFLNVRKIVFRLNFTLLCVVSENSFHNFRPDLTCKFNQWPFISIGHFKMEQ